MKMPKGRKEIEKNKEKYTEHEQLNKTMQVDTNRTS